MCTGVRCWWGGGDNSELPECHILPVTEERMCQQGYGSSVLLLSKSIKCKTKPKVEFMLYSAQSLKGSDHLRPAVKSFFLFFILFYWKIKIKTNKQTPNCRKTFPSQDLVGVHNCDASHLKLKTEYVLAGDTWPSLAFANGESQRFRIPAPEQTIESKKQNCHLLILFFFPDFSGDAIKSSLILLNKSFLFRQK